MKLFFFREEVQWFSQDHGASEFAAGFGIFIVNLQL